jgi:TM2 domain-containing membrane protein YozV
MQCHKCGYILSVTSKFCPGCGTTVEDTPYVPGAGLTGNAVAPARAMPPAPLPSPQALAPPVDRAGGDSYYLMLAGERSGPFTSNQMKTMWQSGNINAGTHYWQTGMAAWQPLANIQHFLDSPSAQQASQPIVINQVNQNVAAFAPAYPPAMMRSTKSRGVYIVLGLFFGCLGIHNFYAGYTGRGAAQLIITLLLGWIGVGLLITGLWALIEIIAVNTDAQGLRM